MLYIEIFKLDWLYIDTVVIILLLVILLIVKIVKFKSRWRLSFSNTALSRIKIEKAYFNKKESVYSIKKINILRNLNLKDSEHPKISIINLTSKNQTKFNRLLARGLSSYGFDVINLKIDIKNAYHNLKEEEHKIEIKKLITLLYIILQKNEIKMDSYFLILNPKSKILCFNVLIENEKSAILLINPKISDNFKRIFSTILLNEYKNQKLLIIFSKKTFFLLKNKNLLKFLKIVPNYEKRQLNINILEKNRKSFKYNETIILGMIIAFLEPYI